MPYRLKAALSRPVVLDTDPPRTIETFLDAVTFLHERVKVISCPETDSLIDALMAAAASEDKEQNQRVTEAFARFIDEHARQVPPGALGDPADLTSRPADAGVEAAVRAVPNVSFTAVVVGLLLGVAIVGAIIPLLPR